MKEALEQELVNFAKEIIAHQGQLNISKMRQQALRLTDKITILGFVEKYYQTLKASEERMLYTMRKVASFIEEHQEEDIFNIDTDVTEIEPLNIQLKKEETAPVAFVAMEPAPITKQSAPAPAAAQPTPPPAFTAPAAPPQPQQHTEPASAPAPAPAAAQQPQQHTEPASAPAPAPAAAQPTPPPAFTAAAQPQPQQHTEPASAPAPAPAAAQPTPPPAFTAPAAQPQPQQHTEPASAPAPAPAAAQPTPPPAFTAPAVAPQPQQHTEPAPYREPLYSIHAKQDPRDETEEEQEARIEKVLQHVFEATQAFIPEAMKYKPFPQEEEEEGVAHEPKDFPTEPEAQPFFAAAAKPATPASTPTAPPPASVAKEPEAEKPHNHNPFEAMAEQFIQQHVQEQAAQQKQQQVQQVQQQAAQQHLHEQMQHNPFGINNATPNTPFGQPTAAPAAQPQPLENPFAATANQDNVKTSWAMNIDQPSSQNIAQPSSQNIAQPQPAARQTPSLEEFLSQKAKTASFERKNPEEPKPTQSLNDRFSKAIQIGLNDKLAFVQKLFFGSESEYNKVLKHLEELHTLEEAAVYIQQQVKPTYNHWKGKEEYEERFLSLILRRFE